MSGKWIFEHDRLLDPYWKPEPGQTYKGDCPKALCEVTVIRQGRVYYRYLGMEGPARWHMPIEKWRTLPAAERECPDCEDWDTLMHTDCCDGAKFECRTRTIYDGAGDPDVQVCRDGHGCAA